MGWFRGVKNNMKTTKQTSLLVLSLVLISLISAVSVVSAQTLIAGKVYTSDYSGLISGADVTATCGSNSLTTTSLDDGTYAVRFDESLCPLDTSVSVSAVKESFSGSSSGIVVVCDGENCDSGLFSVINLAVKSQSGSTGTGDSSWRSRGGYYYFCGNNICDTGENVNTCPKDCKVVETQTTPTNTENTQNTQGDSNSNSNTEEIQETIPENTTQSGFSRITGAVTGTLGTAGWIIIIIFLLGIVGAYIAVRMLRKN